MIEIIEIWHPIEFASNWLQTDTSKLDELAPSWYTKREELKEGAKEYEEFINRLKRQHAIETGIVEKLYDLKEGITQTFIKEGFVESYLQHGDTNIPPIQLISYLRDHFAAIDFVFDVVKDNRSITKGFILELHQLVTQHQYTTDAIDSLGNIIKVELLRGQFKQFENNPMRADGTKYLYCPPIHVESEVDKLVEILQELEEGKVKPVIMASWFHHAFTQIHPFQDGNGRLARLLSSLILIKHGLFPFTVRGVQKREYIDGLEAADLGNPQVLVDFFCTTQKKNIEEALNLQLEVSSSTTFTDVAEVLSKKLESWKLGNQKERLRRLENNRQKVFDFTSSVLENAIENLQSKIDESTARIIFESAYPSASNYYWFTHQIVDYAKTHNYFFNRNNPRGWFKIAIVLSEERQYQLIVSIHHYGYETSTIAIGAILEFIEPARQQNPQYQDRRVASQRQGRNDNIISSLPLDIEPHIISLEANIGDLKLNLRPFLENVITIALAQIASEIG
jgi:Fic family protein